MDRTPAISIRQPWAELIINGKKTIEVRSWSTGYRGLLWVHTGLRSIPELEKNLGFSDLFVGGYVGSVILDAVIPLDRHRWAAWISRHLCRSEDYLPGQYGWLLSSPHKFARPIPGPGQLNLFYPTPELHELLQRASPTNKDIQFEVRP